MAEFANFQLFLGMRYQSFMKTVQQVQRSHKPNVGDALTEQTICFVYPNGDVIICTQHQNSSEKTGNAYSRR